jgi:hypothetical protein
MGVLALQLTAIACNRVPPGRWSVGLQVMHKKIDKICLVEKLRVTQLYQADFNCYNHFAFSWAAMDALTANSYPPEESFSQKESTAKDANINKTLTDDLSRQARHPMMVVSVDAANCYDRVSHVIMSLVWLALTANAPAIVATLICHQMMKFFQWTGFGDSKTFFGGQFHTPHVMGLGQSNHAAPPSWIRLSAVMVNIYKQLDLGTEIHFPILDNIIHTMGAMYVNNLDLYTWKDSITNPAELMIEAQREVTQWSLILNATVGALKLEKCFWYLPDYTCKEGVWSYAVHSDFELSVTNPDGSRSSIKQEELSTSKKMLDIYDSPAGGNQGHLEYIHGKITR